MCFGIWEPEKQGMPFVAQKGNPWPLRCDDVAEMRAVLEAKGVQFFGDTFDTGVCHMAIFADPDGNQLMLHRRSAPAPASSGPAGTRRPSSPAGRGDPAGKDVVEVERRRLLELRVVAGGGI